MDPEERAHTLIVQPTRELQTKRFWFGVNGRIDARVVQHGWGAWKELGGGPMDCGE